MRTVSVVPLAGWIGVGEVTGELAVDPVTAVVVVVASGVCDWVEVINGPSSLGAGTGTCSGPV